MDFRTDSLDKHSVYKMLVSMVVPRPIAFVTTKSESGIVNAAPFSFFNLLGSDPPIVGLGIAPGPDGSEKDTLANIRTSSEFVVQMVDDTLIAPMNIGAINFPREVSEVIEAKLHLRDALAVSVPVIAEALVHLECVLEQIVEIGSNRIVLGRIVAFGIGDNYIDPSNLHIDTPSLKLIGRMHGGGWYTHTNNLFELNRLTVEQWNNLRG